MKIKERRKIFLKITVSLVRVLTNPDGSYLSVNEKEGEVWFRTVAFENIREGVDERGRNLLKLVK